MRVTDLMLHVRDFDSAARALMHAGAMQKVEQSSDWIALEDPTSKLRVVLTSGDFGATCALAATSDDATTRIAGLLSDAWKVVGGNHNLTQGGFVCLEHSSGVHLLFYGN